MDVALVILVTMTIAFAIGIPIGVAIGWSVLVSFLYTAMPMAAMAQRMYTAVDSFTLAAIPFFMLAGALMEVGGLSKRLVRFAMSLVGTFSGALAYVQILASVFFAAISGSSPATTAAIGSAMIPQMEREGYPKDFSAAVQSIAGTIGTIIPPSIPMVVYAVIANVSIGKLFLAGFIPGIIYAISLMVVVRYKAKKYHYKSNKSFSWKEVWLSFKEAIWALLVPFIILGGIYSGIFTPTEAGVVAAVFGLFVGIFIYKELDFKKVMQIFATSSTNTAMVLLIISASNAFSWLLARQGVAVELGQWFGGISSSPTVFLALSLVFFLIVGTFMETIASILIITPILFPISQQMGIDPVHFGIILTMVMSHGMATPPVAENANIAAGIAGVSFDAVCRELWPFLIAGGIACLIVTFIPELATFVPNLFY
jgi:C4-dicarboxylate transporter, DctM subunit